LFGLQQLYFIFFISFETRLHDSQAALSVIVLLQVVLSILVASLAVFTAKSDASHQSHSERDALGDLAKQSGA